MAVIITALIAFIATNVDDIFLLALYFTQINTTFRIHHIVWGQYIGFGAILAISLLGFVGALVIPGEIIGLLGLAPIYMGIRRLRRKPEHPAAETEFDFPQSPSESPSFMRAFFSPQIYGVAAVTFANGGDNISIYIPLFAGKTILEVAIILIIFASLIAVWCYLGYQVANYNVVAQTLQRYGHFIVPIVLIGLGGFILVENGTLQILLTLLQ